MIISVADLKLGTIDSNLLEKSRVDVSAFQRAGTKLTSLPLGGVTIGSLSDIESFGVGEGGKKLASGTAGAWIVKPNKFVSTVVETEEVFRTAENLVQAILTKQPQAHARKFDLYVAGLVALPPEFSHFATLEAAQEVEISTGVEASTDMDDAHAAVLNGNVTAYVLTTTMKAYLHRQRVGTTGARVFEIIGDSKSGTIDGVPYFCIAHTAKVGFLGDFDNYYWGVNGISDEFMYKIHTAGNQTDVNGIVHNLNEENKVALVNELLQGSGVSNIANFVKIVPAPAV
jgi:hypothetical protein